MRKLQKHGTSGMFGLPMISFFVMDSRLVVSPLQLHIGASPDGVVRCNCCGQGVLEVKCPFSYRGQPISSGAADRNFCLHFNDGKLELKRTHKYFCQVQTQLFTCDVEYCDFVVCTFCEDASAGLFIERVLRDENFWQKCLTASACTF